MLNYPLHEKMLPKHRNEETERMMIVQASRVGFGDDATHIVQTDSLFSVKCS
jgi:hypothetical protein